MTGSEKKYTNKSKLTVLTITRIALLAAVICVLGPLSIHIPISPVPISLGILGIFLAVYINGWLYGILGFHRRDYEACRSDRRLYVRIYSACFDCRILYCEIRE